MFKLTSKPILLLIVCLLVSSLLFGCKSKGVEGNDWLIAQKACLDDLEAYASGMDDVYTLYIIGSISENDFLLELNLLKQQYAALLKFYDDLKSEYPVKEGTHTYVSKRGSEAIEKCYSVLGKVIDASVNKNGKPLPADELAYSYMGFKQELTKYIAEYVTAIVWLEEASGQFATTTQEGS